MTDHRFRSALLRLRRDPVLAALARRSPCATRCTPRSASCSTFFTAACIWLLLDAEFLAIALVLVYVGAVMVLFLFVVMMLDIDLEPLREGFCARLPVGAHRRAS